MSVFFIQNHCAPGTSNTKSIPHLLHRLVRHISPRVCSGSVLATSKDQYEFDAGMRHDEVSRVQYKKAETPTMAERMNIIKYFIRSMYCKKRRNQYDIFMLSLYNTLSRTIEPFKPLKEDHVKFYGCGPTVYNYAHIGNLCCYAFEDIIIRSLEFLGYEVDALMNLTDIDDKTIRDSQKEHKTLKVFTEHYTKLFFEDLTKLGITSFKRHKPISELVPEMIGMTQKLIDTKHAYVSDDGSVYFDIKSFKKYGNLAHLDMKGMKAGARVNNDEYNKDNVSDFALWK